MNEVYVDTVKIREKGEEIIEQVEELKEVIEAMFRRIDNIPTSTQEWTGESAKAFASLAMSDKVQYINYANDLYKYGKYLIDCADYLEKTVKGIRRET